jgi:hypothetical protein
LRLKKAAEARSRAALKHKPWLQWPAAKKRAVYEDMNGLGYSRLRLKMGSVCPPSSTIRGWSHPDRPTGRPRLLTAQEEEVVLDTIKRVRGHGAPLDNEGLQHLAESTLFKLRKPVTGSEGGSDGPVPGNAVTTVTLGWLRAFRKYVKLIGQ